MSGDFTIVNAALVHDLKARGLWDEVMISDLKYFDGSLGGIDRVPEDLKALYATAFEIDSVWPVFWSVISAIWIGPALPTSVKPSYGVAAVPLPTMVVGAGGRACSGAMLASVMLAVNDTGMVMPSPMVITHP